jgi:pSer/pThr/pTyr-binding forkhead associated (FHA) protein
MSVLRTIESKIEGLFEGVFGRAFRTHVQPVELARKLAKEMDEHRSVSVSRVYVPNEYTIYLSSADRQQFLSYEGSLIGELQEYLTEHARREAYALLTPPRVKFATDDDLAIGEFGIATRVAQPEDGLPSLPTSAPPVDVPVRSVSIPVPAPTAPIPVEAPAAVATTMVYRQTEPETVAPVVPVTPEPPREIVTLTLDGRAHPVTPTGVVVGRSRECDLRVADGNASRRHAEVKQDGESWVVVDLGSTNGTELNGRRITRETLVDGDRITIGATDIVFGHTRG